METLTENDPDVQVTTKQSEKHETKSEHVKKYVIILHNDNDHSYDYVVLLIHKVFGYDIPRCVALTNQVHTQGLCMVWIGTQEVGELKCEMIANAVPDIGPKGPIQYPLRAVLEPES